MEPMPLKDIQYENKHQRDNGFNMIFAAKVLGIENCPDSIKPLLQETRATLNMSEAPQGRVGCEDCLKVEYMLGVIK